MTDAAARPDTFAALRFRDFRLLIAGRFIAQLGEMMVTVAIGWDLYQRTRDPLLLGLVGLVQVVPVILLALPGGYVADRYNRKWVTGVSQAVLVACSVGLALISSAAAPLWMIFALLAVIGTARAFNNPAEGALTPQTVDRAHYANAATWNSIVWQVSAIGGPAVGGLIIAVSSATMVYVVNAVAGLVLIGSLLLLRSKQVDYGETAEPPFKSLETGLRFLRGKRILLGAITLDMFAVLFGGAVALLPIYATDILNADAIGLGLMRAAPSVGALVMALLLARLGSFGRSGWVLLLAVAGFGLATIIFGFSTHFWLSLLMLALTGALDNISVVVRSTLFMTTVPDEMRGRVGAVNWIFIGISNEMGSFQSGVAAHFLGPVWAVVTGGIGSILVVALVARLVPELRRMGRLGSS
jgi:MFS family permease